jgi:hypothetical protein
VYRPKQNVTRRRDNYGQVGAWGNVAAGLGHGFSRYRGCHGQRQQNKAQQQAAGQIKSFHQNVLQFRVWLLCGVGFDNGR